MTHEGLISWLWYNMYVSYFWTSVHMEWSWRVNQFTVMINPSQFTVMINPSLWCKCVLAMSEPACTWSGHEGLISWLWCVLAISEPACTWSGQLPMKFHRNPTYSCKVFLGGVPWDITEGESVSSRRAGNKGLIWVCGSPGYILAGSCLVKAYRSDLIWGKIDLRSAKCLGYLSVTRPGWVIGSKTGSSWVKG